jgi:uncharacterized Zn-finger protein
MTHQPFTHLWTHISSPPLFSVCTERFHYYHYWIVFTSTTITVSLVFFGLHEAHSKIMLCFAFQFLILLLLWQPRLLPAIVFTGFTKHSTKYFSIITPSSFMWTITHFPFLTMKVYVVECIRTYVCPYMNDCSSISCSHTFWRWSKMV